LTSFGGFNGEVSSAGSDRAHQVLYLPKSDQAPESTVSASHGKEIPVDASGVIELTAKQAEALTAGQVEQVKEENKKK
jgi:hypothetical protein